MSDDEYFNDDDLFTAEELNNIPLLNQPPSPIIHSLDITNESGVTSRPSQPRVSNAPGTSTNNLNSVALDRPAAPQNSLSPGNQGRNQVSAPVTPARASGSGGPAPIAVQRSASRLSTIMNALRTSQIGQNPGQSYLLYCAESKLIFPTPRPACWYFGTSFRTSNRAVTNTKTKPLRL